jgi:hypothetical protein
VCSYVYIEIDRCVYVLVLPGKHHTVKAMQICAYVHLCRRTYRSTEVLVSNIRIVIAMYLQTFRRRFQISLCVCIYSCFLYIQDILEYLDHILPQKCRRRDQTCESWWIIREKREGLLLLGGRKVDWNNVGVSMYIYAFGSIFARAYLYVVFVGISYLYAAYRAVPVRPTRPRSPPTCPQLFVQPLYTCACSCLLRLRRVCT